MLSAAPFGRPRFFAPGFPSLQPSVAVWGSFSISRAGAWRPAGPFYVAYLGRDPHETPCARTALCALALQEKGSSGRGNVAPVCPLAEFPRPEASGPWSSYGLYAFLCVTARPCTRLGVCANVRSCALGLNLCRRCHFGLSSQRRGFESGVALQLLLHSPRCSQPVL